MPLVQHNNLPSIDRVLSEGVSVCSHEEIDAMLPTVKIGFLNMMPDAALAATERQFLRLVGSNNNINCYVYPFYIDGFARSQQAQDYIDQYYIDYAAIKVFHIDALIITGANVSQPLLQNELFWPSLIEVLAWAKENVCSTLCSCLATHAAVKLFYNIDRQHLGDKCWGVFQHKVKNKGHQLLLGTETNLEMCHSRFNDIPADLFNSQNVEVLIESEQVGVQLAAEPDMRIVYFQGHPEYDDISLLKEYKREIMRYIAGELDGYPPVPDNYFDQQAMQYVNKYQSQVEQSENKQKMLELFPESSLRGCITNTWQSASSQIFSNWMNFVAKQ